MKAFRVSRGIALLFLGSRHCIWGWGPAPRPGHLYPQERPATHCTGGWVGPRVGLEAYFYLFIYFEKQGYRAGFIKSVFQFITFWLSRFNAVVYWRRLLLLSWLLLYFINSIFWRAHWSAVSFFFQFASYDVKFSPSRHVCNWLTVLDT